MGVPYVIFTVIDTDTPYHSYDDFGLILSSQSVGIPPVKEERIDIYGMNGSLDMTEALGRVYYKDRTLEFTFSVISDVYGWDELKRRVCNALHGQRVRIQIYSDTSVYYVGRCFVDKYQSSKTLNTIVMKCICNPFAYSEDTVKAFILGTETPTTVTQEIIIDGQESTLKIDLTGITSEEIRYQVINKITGKVIHNVVTSTPVGQKITLSTGIYELSITGMGTAIASYSQLYI